MRPASRISAMTSMIPDPHIPVTGVSGGFEKGDCVRLIDPAGRAVGVGLAAYAADDAARLRGRRSDEIETLLGYRGASVLIHRDDMVLDDR